MLSEFSIFHRKPAKKVGLVLVQNLGQIRSNVVKKVTKQVVKPPAWKFMPIVARNAKFKGC